MPYSDNLYSMVDDDSDAEPIGGPSSRPRNLERGIVSQHAPLDTHNISDAHEGSNVEDPHVLSPTDGYFGTVTDVSSECTAPTSSNVPYVPNVLVEDPSLERNAADGKTREAEQERLRNSQGLSNPDNGYTAVYPSHTTAASRNGPPSAYAVPSAQQYPGSLSRSVGATYHSPSSSAHIPLAAAPTSYTPYGTRTSAYHVQHMPILPSEAPPAYTPSPISPSHSQGAVGFSRNYNTFSPPTSTASDMGRPEETQALLAHQPESMRDHDPDGRGNQTPTWRNRIKRVGQYRNWGRGKTALAALLLLLAAFSLRTILLIAEEGKSGHNKPPADKPHTKPDDPAMSYPDIDGGFNWGSASTCTDAQITRPTETFDLSFDGNKPLSFLEKTIDDDGRRGWSEVNVQGAVILRRAGSGTPDSSVTVEIVVNDDRLNVDTLWDAESQFLRIIVPHRVDWRHNGRPCVNIKATVWVPEGGKLNLLRVDATHLDVKLLDNLSISVSEQTNLVSTVGAITAASTGTDARDDKIIDLGAPESFRFHSRIIEVKTTAANIKGSWPLYDYLNLQSTAGNIKVCVEPKEADSDAPKPAILYVKSLSGDVDLREPIHGAEDAFGTTQALAEPDRRRAQLTAETLIPPRDYRVDVHTTSGDIRGAAAFSSSANFRSTSGDVRLDLLPVLDLSLAEDDARGVSLQTASTSGSTDVTVLEPLWVDAGDSVGSYVMAREDRALRCLYSSHTTTSAHIRLRYPSSWEGEIALSSLSGGLEVGGEGLKVIRKGGDWGGINKSVLARKGEEGKGGKVVGKSTSGGLDVWVGKK